MASSASPPLETDAIASGGTSGLPDDSDVLIVGLGPVGLLCALLVGQMGHRVLAVERWPRYYPLPRACTFDHEIARILAAAGVDANDDPAIDFHDAVYKVFGAQGETLMEVDWFSTAADGWRNRYWFNQPELESHLRMVVSSLPNVVLRTGVEAVAVADQGDHVEVRLQETQVRDGDVVERADAEPVTVRARYVVGADGANSSVRRSLGIEMVDLQFYYDWLVVDLIEHEPKRYDPPHYQSCVPSRPTTVVPGGPGRRRWEFMALPGESLDELGTVGKTWELLAPFGNTPDNATIVRSVVWRFQARYAAEWRRGRVCLAGDAAHLMPPFAGEGMCAGLRDVMGLAWRLDLLVTGRADDTLLDSYSSERQAHARWYIDFSVDVGKLVCVTDEEQARARDAGLIAARDPAGNGIISPHEAVLGPGVWLADDDNAGRPSIQSRVAYRGRSGLFDDVVGRGWIVLSRETGGGSALTEVESGILARIGGSANTIGPAGSGADIIDLSGRYGQWMDARGVDHLVIRPDFYVAATAATPAGLRSAIAAIAGALGIKPFVPEPA